MIASDTARANKFERSARPSGLAVRTWIKFKALVKFKGCEISNTRGISDFRGILKRRGILKCCRILNIVEFKRCEISNARKISGSRERALKTARYRKYSQGAETAGKF